MNIFKSCIPLFALISAVFLTCPYSLAADLADLKNMAILPSQTDPNISSFDLPHMIWSPVGKGRGQLLVHLPGTGDKPQEDAETQEWKARAVPFMQIATQLGYHAIWLMYPDSIASQKKCSRSDDPSAYMKFRLAIIRGGRIDPQTVITPADCIENRLTKLLLFLAAKYPNQGWEQYIDKSGNPKWEKITVSGSSQGGGHAYVLAKIHKLSRVILFASPKDFSFHFNRPAGGFDDHTLTPLSRFFTYNHLRDNGNGCTYDQHMQTMKQIGLTRLGMVEAPTDDFHHAHNICTGAELPDGFKGYHGSVGKLGPKGFAFNPQVWKYMLTESVQ